MQIFLVRKLMHICLQVPCYSPTEVANNLKSQKRIFLPTPLDCVTWFSALEPRKYNTVSPTSISIDYYNQKNDMKDETVSQDATDNDKLKTVWHWK